ncbi:MAG: sigma-70 family RNA polymerase sigma factor [Thermotogaceae bacterium]|nr:sigma-70 family RNA polymerase sigma factor [Thermotogaceae bacterium]
MDVIKYRLRSKRTESLIEMAQAGLKEALDIIVERYYPMVVKISSNYYAPWAETSDIIQSGLVGLIKAVYYFNPGKSKFSTFAWRSIDSEIKSFLTYLNRKKNQILSDAMSVDGLSTSSEDEEAGYAFGTEEGISKSALMWYIMEDVIKELKDIEKEIFSMWLNGYSYTDISESLDVTNKKVDNTVQKVKRILKRKLGNISDMILEELVR